MRYDVPVWWPLLTGPEAAAAYIQGSGIKLCALGADGDVLQELGLQVSDLTYSMKPPAVTCCNPIGFTVCWG